MKKLFKSFLILSAIAMAIPCFAQTPNTLTKKEKKAGWELLFNGKDFSGWRQCNGTAMPANWVIEDNAMKVFTGEGKKPGQGANGDILYQNKIIAAALLLEGLVEHFSYLGIGVVHSLEYLGVHSCHTLGSFF